MQVYIERNIAAGKSTLLKHMETTHSQTVEVVYVPVEMWRNLAGHNLLGNFYEETQKNGFTLQVSLQTTQCPYLEISFFCQKVGNFYLFANHLVIYSTHLSRVCTFEVQSTNPSGGAVDLLLIQLLRHKSLPHKGKDISTFVQFSTRHISSSQQHNIGGIIY